MVLRGQANQSWAFGSLDVHTDTCRKIYNLISRDNSYSWYLLNCLLRYHRTRRNSICLKFINHTELCPHCPCGENWFTQSNRNGQKHPDTFLIVFFVSPQIVQNVVVLTHFFQHMPHVENTFKYINTYAFVFCWCVLWASKSCCSIKLVMFHKKRDQDSLTVNISTFITFCIKAVHLSDYSSLPSIMVHRKYMYRSICTYMSFERAAHLGKSCVNSTQFRRDFRKKKSLIEVCWKFCS